MARVQMSKSSKRRSFTPEYKAEVVRLCQQLGKSPRTVAVELGLTPSSVAAWVRQAEVDAAGGTASALATSEREELARVRAELKKVRQERDILKHAVAFFAKEGTT